MKNEAAIRTLVVERDRLLDLCDKIHATLKAVESLWGPAGVERLVEGHDPEVWVKANAKKAGDINDAIALLTDAESAPAPRPLGKAPVFHQVHTGDKTCFKCGAPYPWATATCPDGTVNIEPIFPVDAS